MANTKKPGGLTVKRAGLKFTTKWKIRDKDYRDGQQFQYAIFTTQKKYESALNFIRQGFTITSGVTWHSVSVGTSATSATVSLAAGSFFPTAKKPYLAGIIFRVRGNRKAYTEREKYKDSKGKTKYRDVTVNPGWSAWAYKGFDITAPAAPKASVAWSEDYINRTTFSWDCGNETQGAPYTRCVYQTVTALDYNGKVENIPAWKSAANNNVTSRQSSIYRDEADLADKNLTRAYRIKAIGPGGESAWRYARHPYGAPEQAVNVTCETTRNEAVGSYHLVIAWTAPNSVANPITKTTAEYLTAEPGGIVETEQGLLPTVPAQAQWTPFPATKDTNGANAFSFDLQETLGDDECLWVHVITTHDNHDTPSEAVLAAKGMLQKPTITNLETDASTHRAEITIQAGTSVPGAFHAIKYEPADGSSDPDAGKIIGIIPNGSTFAQIQCPAWTATPAFGVYAVLGEEAESYTRDDGVTIYTLNEVMTSEVESSGGNVPKAPGNVRASQIGTSDTIQALWDVVWNEATGAEVSWADHADAWISTEQPQTFDVQNLRESVLNITGLELGKVWFVRVRLYQTNTGGTNVYGPYSDIIPVDLSTIPAVPDLQISDEDGIIPATGSTVASWVYVSEDGTRQKAATLAEVTYEDDEPVYTRLIGLTTQQQATLNAEALGWETGTQHEVAVQVTSESGNPSKWSAPVMITIADAISCDITQTSLEYDSVPVNPEEYSGNPIIFDTGEQEKEVLSLNVSLLPKQEGTPSQDSTVYNEPYLSKTSPSFNSEYDKLVGGTVAWNQLLSTSSGEQKKTIYSGMFSTDNVAIYNGHRYLVSFLQPAGCGVYRQNRTNFTVGYLNYSAPTVATLRQFIATATGTSTESFGGLVSKLETTEELYQLTKCMITDLTQLFGTAIADYIYSLEQANAGAGVAWFKKLFPKPYYEYNAGELMSVNTSAHNTVGFNQADMSAIEIGKAWNAGSNSARASLFIPVLPNTTYCLNVDGTSGFDNVYWGEVNAKGDLTNNRLYAPSSFPYVVTTKANTHVGVIQFNKTDVSASDFANVKVNLNLSWDGERDGEYEPYVKHTYPLDSSLTLRGIPKLDSSNNLYYDGDTYESDGTVTRKYGTIDLSAQTWNYRSAWKSWYTDYIADMRGTDTGAKTPEFICDKYDTIATNYGLTPQDFNGITSTTKGAIGCRILVRNGSTTVAPTGHLVYELATPTTESADPYQNPQAVGSTESYTDNRAVPIPVGHESRYANIYPISGYDNVNITDSNGTDTITTTVTLPHTVYGADVDVTGGVSKETWQNIASYNGETISEPWLSSMDEYVQGATPTTGAQVTYKLATPTDLQTTPTDVELLTGVNNISADGDMELTIADMIESGYYLKELPLTATVTGAGPGGQTSLRIERAESYELDGPDDKTRNGFKGAAAAEVQQAGENQIEVDLADLIGRLDDGARYRIRASVQDAAGQSAEAEPVEFTVLWNKQASIPGGTAEIENGVAIITPEAPENANEGDTVDIYRLSADRPELIVRGGTFGTQYVDPYPTLNEFGGYRIVTVTEYGDYITEANEMAWTDIRTNNDSLFQYIDFDGNQLELKYNAELSNTWTKQFTATRYLGGSIRGDWLEGTQQEANVNGIVLRDIDQDTYKMLRALGDFSGICHVRTTDGSNFTANINVQSGSTYNSPGHPESVTLTITRVDNPRADGMTLAEWQTQESE